jgi:hypothetical protein
MPMRMPSDICDAMLDGARSGGPQLFRPTEHMAMPSPSITGTLKAEIITLMQPPLSVQKIFNGWTEN